MAARVRTSRVISTIHVNQTPKRRSQVVGVFGFGRGELSSQAKRLLMIMARNISKGLLSPTAASARSVKGSSARKQARSLQRLRTSARQPIQSAQGRRTPNYFLGK